MKIVIFMFSDTKKGPLRAALSTPVPTHASPSDNFLFGLPRKQICFNDSVNDSTCKANPTICEQTRTTITRFSALTWKQLLLGAPLAVLTQWIGPAGHSSLNFGPCLKFE